MAHHHNWKRNLLFVWLSQFLSITGFSLALPFAPFFIQELGINDPDKIKFWTALSTSVTGLGLAVAAPVWGTLADRHGRKLMMIRANFSAMIILAGMAFSPNVYVFTSLRLLQGLFTGTISAAMTFVATSAPKDRQGMALGSLSAAVFSGMLVGPMVGGFLAEGIGLRHTFLVSSTLLLISALMISLPVREDFARPESPERNLTWRSRLAALGPGTPILILLFLMAFSRSFDKPMLPLFVQEIHGSLAGAARWTGALGGTAALGAILAGIVLGRLADRIPSPRIGKFSALGTASFMLLMGIFPVFGVLFPAVFLMAFCAGGLDPVFQVWLSRVTPETHRGRIFGWAVSAKAGGWAMAPLVSGAIAVPFGYRAIYFAGPVFFLLLIPAIQIVSVKVLQLGRRKKDSP